MYTPAAAFLGGKKYAVTGCQKLSHERLRITVYNSICESECDEIKTIMTKKSKWVQEAYRMHL
jgi:hypothetical protein